VDVNFDTEKVKRKMEDIAADHIETMARDLASKICAKAKSLCPDSELSNEMRCQAIRNGNDTKVSFTPIEAKDYFIQAIDGLPSTDIDDDMRRALKEKFNSLD